MKANILLLLASLIVASLIGELTLRVLGYDPAFVNPLNAFHEADPTLGWIGVPGYTARFQKPEFDVEITFNQEGFRQKQSDIAPETDAKKVFFLGDSFTWGWGVNNGELFTNVLQNELGPGYDIQNFGVNAYSTAQELLLLKRLIDAQRIPDSLYIMAFYNDFADNLDPKHQSRPYYKVGGGDPTLTNTPVTQPMGGWSKVLRRHSYLLTFLSYWANYYQATKDHNALQAEVLNTTRSKTSLSDNSYAVMRDVLKQFQILSAQNGIQLQVVYIAHTAAPTANAVYRQAMQHICAGLGIRFIDLTPEFAPSAKKYHIANDDHWNAAGHALAAEILLPYIK